MSVHQQLSSLTPPPGDTVLTIGTFDGVHLGHQHLFRCLNQQAKINGLCAAAIAFRNQPRSVLIPGTNVEYITSWVERKSLIKAQGVEHLVDLDFTKELSLLGASEFVSLLVKQLRMKILVVGPDFALGYKREGDIPTLRDLGVELGFRVIVLDPETVNGQRIRSRVLRKMVTVGDVDGASVMLGRSFCLSGVVIEGDHRGKTLGFPTANLDLQPDILIPKNGIYATWAKIGETRKQSVTSIGVRPTFGEGPRRVEVFILDFASDIYGETVSLEFVSFLRDEALFPTVNDLVQQMNLDVEVTRTIIDGNARKEIAR